MNYVTEFDLNIDFVLIVSTFWAKFILLFKGLCEKIVKRCDAQRGVIGLMN